MLFMVSILFVFMCMFSFILSAFIMTSMSAVSFGESGLMQQVFVSFVSSVMVLMAPEYQAQLSSVPGSSTVQYTSIFLGDLSTFLFIRVLSNLDFFFFFLYLLYDPKMHMAFSGDLLSIVFGSSVRGPLTHDSGARCLPT